MRLLHVLSIVQLFWFILGSAAVASMPARNPSREHASFSTSLFPRLHRTAACLSVNQNVDVVLAIPRGGGVWFPRFFPPGWNPFGYKLTSLGEEFLKFDGSINSDVGRFLAGLKQRKRFYKIKEQWLEILRVSKSGQSMRIYKQLSELIGFCLRARLID